MKFWGNHTAICTPFNLDGSEIDFESLDNLIEFQLEKGAHGIVVAGTTGEVATLSDIEYKKLIEFVVKKVAGRVPVTAGAGLNSTLKTIQYLKICEELKVDAALIVTPYYNKPPQNGLLEHYRALKKATSLPIIAYNVPGRTSVNLLPKTVRKMVDEKLIVGIKEATGSMDQALDLVALVGQDIAVMSGEDSLVFSIMSIGGTGVISAAANVAPSQFSKIAEAIKSKQFELAAQLQLGVLPIVRMAFMETNPIPVKTGLYLMKVIKHPTMRLPLCQAEERTISEIKSVLALS